MDRRDFLKTGTFAAVSLAASRGLVAGKPASPTEEVERGSGKRTSPIAHRLPGSKLKLSLAAYSFRRELGGDDPEMTLDDFIDLCARERLDATELTSYYFRRTDPEYLHSLRRRAYVNGLAISGTPVGNDFCLPPGPKREHQIRHVKEWIDRVVLLGSQTIRVFAGKVPEGHSEEEARDRAVEGLREVSSYAGERGVLLALENHGGITSTADQLIDLVRRVESPWLGVNLDTGNFHRDVYESIEKAAPLAVACQVKVEVKERGKRVEEADFRRLVSILGNTGYRGYLALEYEAREDARTAVPRYLEKLRKAMA